MTIYIIYTKIGNKTEIVALVGNRETTEEIIENFNKKAEKYKLTRRLKYLEMDFKESSLFIKNSELFKAEREV